jgi:hypothetical protein
VRDESGEMCELLHTQRDRILMEIIKDLYQSSDGGIAPGPISEKEKIPEIRFLRISSRLISELPPQ